MDALYVLLATAGNALVFAWVARRLLGVPVGWPRTIALSAVVSLSAPVLPGLVAETGG